MNVTIRDKTFKIYIEHEKIAERINDIASQINFDYHNKRPVFLSVLNGSFFFTADILKQIHLQCEITFVKLASYMGTQSTGQVKELFGLSTDIRGRHVIILEDIIDTGKTLKSLIEQLEQHYPASIKVASLLLKKEALVEDIQPEYLGFEVPGLFLVGYGLDYDQLGRNLKDIYILTD